MAMVKIFAADNSILDSLPEFLGSGINFIQAISSYIHIITDDKGSKKVVPAVLVFYEQAALVPTTTETIPVSPSTVPIDSEAPYEMSTIETDAYKRFKEMYGDNNGSKSL